MSNQNKWIIGGIVVVVAAIIIYVVYTSNKSNQAPQATQQTPTETATTTPTGTPVTTGTGIGTNLSYGDAIKAYPERFQFSSQCEGTPATIAVRKGAPVMLDNRNNGSIVIRADAETFNLPGFGYAVFYPQIIENLAVTCNGKNSVTLNVEK